MSSLMQMIRSTETQEGFPKLIGKIRGSITKLNYILKYFKEYTCD